MWKTILLCASLFGSAALGLLAAARWIEPSVLPLAAAIAVSLIGVVLILAAPGRGEAAEKPVQPLAAPRASFAQTLPRLEAIDEAGSVTLAAATGPQPTLH